jgi:hypothetical protein
MDENTMKYRTTISCFLTRLKKINYCLNNNEATNKNRLIEKIRTLLRANRPIDPDFRAKADRYINMSNKDLRRSDVLWVDWL